VSGFYGSGGLSQTVVSSFLYKGLTWKGAEPVLTRDRSAVCRKGFNRMFCFKIGSFAFLQRFVSCSVRLAFLKHILILHQRAESSTNSNWSWQTLQNTKWTIVSIYSFKKVPLLCPWHPSLKGGVLVNIFESNKDHISIDLEFSLTGLCTKIDWMKARLE